MSHLTTHILDATSGTPARNVAIALGRHLDGGEMQEIDEGFTDVDGRLSLGPDLLEPGMYSISFATGAYFEDHGVESFYPVVNVTFTVSDERHYHVPLLLSPFAYSTYRGS